MESVLGLPGHVIRLARPVVPKVRSVLSTRNELARANIDRVVTVARNQSTRSSDRGDRR